MLGDENVMELDIRGNSHTTLYIYEKSLTCTLWKGECYGMWIISKKHKINMHILGKNWYLLLWWSFYSSNHIEEIITGDSDKSKIYT